jgi:hypothetical protein
MSQAQVDTLRYLMREPRDNVTLAQQIDILTNLGFAREHLDMLGNKILRILSLILEPFHLHEFNTNEWHLGERLDQILGAEKWWFRMAGPPWILFLMRSFSGLLSATQSLGARINFRDIFFSVACEPNTPTTVPRAIASSLSTSISVARGIEPLSQSLKVAVWKDESLHVSIELPSRAAHELENLIPEDSMSKLIAGGIDLQAMKDRIIATNFAPQLLFELSIDEKRYKVWLE